MSKYIIRNQEVTIRWRDGKCTHITTDVHAWDGMCYIEHATLPAQTMSVAREGNRWITEDTAAWRLHPRALVLELADNCPDPSLQDLRRNATTYGWEQFKRLEREYRLDPTMRRYIEEIEAVCDAINADGSNGRAVMRHIMGCKKIATFFDLRTGNMRVNIKRSRHYA